MRRKNIFITAQVVMIFTACQIGWTQPDNGNQFEKSWSADISVFQGDWGELSVWAMEGLDIDQDGHREFIAYDHVIGLPRFDRLQLWENAGDNEFFLAWEVVYTDWQTQYQQGHGITVADMDDDGNQEVWIATEGFMYVYEWDGTQFESGTGLPQEPTLTIDPLQDNLGRSNIRQIRILNLDPDPEPEIFMGYTIFGGIYSVIASLPSRDLSDPNLKYEFADDFPWNCSGMTIADFDGDGNMEIFSSDGPGEPVMRVYENDGIDTYVVKPAPSPEELVLVPSFDGAGANPVFNDFDGDGKSEIVITDIHGKVWVITSDASNNFTDFSPSAWTFLMQMPTVKSNGLVRSGWLDDLDQDGKPDIYYNDFTAKAILDLEYQGGPVTDPMSWTLYEIYKEHRLLIGYLYPAGDLDGDGRHELVFASDGESNENLQVIESTDIPSSVREKVSSEPIQFSLDQNYPNPFNPSTTIQFSLPEKSNVTVKIFSLLGQPVRILINQIQVQGSHQISWDGRDDKGQVVPSGVYIYRVEAGSIVQSRKMVFIR